MKKMSKKKMSKKIKSIQSISDVVFSKLFGQKAIKRLNQFLLFCEHDDKIMKVTTVALLNGKEAKFQLVNGRLKFVEFIDHKKRTFLQIRSTTQTAFCSNCKNRDLKKNIKCCGRCNAVYYCADGACQVANWADHKTWCKAAGCLDPGTDTHVKKNRVGPRVSDMYRKYQKEGGTQ